MYIIKIADFDPNDDDDEDEEAAAAALEESTVNIDEPEKWLGFTN